MWIRLLKRIGFGFLIGIVVGNCITLIEGISWGVSVSPDLIEQTGSEAAAMALQSLVLGLYGALGMGGMSLYEIERWPLALPTVIHYLLIAAGFIAMDRLLRWHGSVPGILAVEGVLLVIFFVIWLIMYVRYKNEVRQLNEELQANRYWQGGTTR